MDASNIRRLKRAQQRRDQRGRHELFGVTDGPVPGSPNLVYVMVPGSPAPLVAQNNGMVRNEKGWPVVVGWDKFNPRTLQVLQVQPNANLNSGTGTTSKHGPTHYYTGTDPAPIHTLQITPLLVFAKTGFVIGINTGEVLTTTGVKRAYASTYDVTSHKPGAGQARWLLVQVTDDALITLKDGTLAAAYTDLVTELIPSPDTGCKWIAAIKLYDGQTAITQTATQQDIVDMRFVLGNGGVGGVGGVGDMTKAVYDPDNDGAVAEADYALTAGDADTLDGSHAAAFAVVGHTHAGTGEPQMVGLLTNGNEDAPELIFAGGDTITVWEAV